MGGVFRSWKINGQPRMSVTYKNITLTHKLRISMRVNEPIHEIKYPLLVYDIVDRSYCWVGGGYIYSP